METIKKSINIASKNAASDKKRLLTIIDAINLGIKKENVNDRLITKLTNKEYDIADVNEVVELLSLILTNIETQKQEQNKQIIDELIRILDHNLEIFEKLEHCVIEINKVLKQHKNEIKEEIKNETNIKTVDSKKSGFKILDIFRPENKILMIFISGSMFFVVLTVMMLVFGSINEKTDGRMLDVVSKIYIGDK